MTKRKKVKPTEVQSIKNIKLGWKVRRQVQQELLQKKLTQYFLMSSVGRFYIRRYPEAMQPMIKDFMLEAEKQTRLRPL
jgi:hypothetical protein